MRSLKQEVEGISHWYLIIKDKLKLEFQDSSIETQRLKSKLDQVENNLIKTRESYENELTTLKATLNDMELKQMGKDAETEGKPTQKC